MARFSATLFAVLSALALARSVYGQACASQLDTSTCLIVFPVTDSASCLSQITGLTKGVGCNEYTYLTGNNGTNICVLKYENCTASDITFGNDPVDACASTIVTSAAALTYQCSGSGSSTPGTSPPSNSSSPSPPSNSSSPLSPSAPTSSTNFVGFCNYKADSCGILLRPITDASLCADFTRIWVGDTGACSEWSYLLDGLNCYMEYSGDDSSCTYTNSQVDTLNASNTTDIFEDNGVCDSSLLPSGLTLTSGCDLPPASPPESTDPGTPPAPKAPGITLFPSLTNRSPPPAGSLASGSPSPPPRSAPPPPAGINGTGKSASIGAAVSFVLAAALAYAL